MAQVIRPETQNTTIGGMALLEGRKVNLRIVEKEDLPLYAEWVNSPEFQGDYYFPPQMSRSEMEKTMFQPSPYEWKDFMIEKKDGTKIGIMNSFYVLHPMGKVLEIGFALIPTERGKGYCTEAAQMMVDYLFLTKEAPCIQTSADVRNTASQRVIERVGFKKEGVMRKRFYCRGEWQDVILFSILREEWSKPKILTTTENKHPVS